MGIEFISRRSFYNDLQYLKYFSATLSKNISGVSNKKKKNVPQISKATNIVLFYFIRTSGTKSEISRINNTRKKSLSIFRKVRHYPFWTKNGDNLDKTKYIVKNTHNPPLSPPEKAVNSFLKTKERLWQSMRKNYFRFYMKSNKVTSR